MPPAGPLTFFLLVALLAVPFWIGGGISGTQLMPGLPAAALMFVCPGLAALVLVARAAAPGRRDGCWRAALMRAGFLR